MQSEIREKYEALQIILKSLGSVAVAYSSGVDSTFLIKVAKDVLGDKAVAITVSSTVFPRRELAESIEFCESSGIIHKIIEVDELAIPGFAENPTDRCYICKKQIFTKILSEAKALGSDYVVEGSNTDDDGDYRPGRRAIAELGVKSPLKEAGLSKSDIRLLSKELGLPTWDKPSFACLASRFPYGERIDADKLSRVEKAEDLLISMNFKQFRVRLHGDMARIELLPEEIGRLLDDAVRSQIVQRFKEYGFTYVSLDLQGYRTGSLNETIVNK